MKERNFLELLPNDPLALIVVQLNKKSLLSLVRAYPNITSRNSLFNIATHLLEQKSPYKGINKMKTYDFHDYLLLLPTKLYIGTLSYEIDTYEYEIVETRRNKYKLLLSMAENIFREIIMDGMERYTSILSHDEIGAKDYLHNLLNMEVIKPIIEFYTLEKLLEFYYIFDKNLKADTLYYKDTTGLKNLKSSTDIKYLSDSNEYIILIKCCFNFIKNKYLENVSSENFDESENLVFEVMKLDFVFNEYKKHILTIVKEIHIN